jgi:hypothetical protein
VLGNTKYDYKDIYKLHKLLGKVLAAFIKIVVYKYVEEPSTVLGCLDLMPDRPLILSYLGEKSKEFYQGFVQGTYKMELYE